MALQSCVTERIASLAAKCLKPNDEKLLASHSASVRRLSHHKIAFHFSLKTLRRPQNFPPKVDHYLHSNLAPFFEMVSTKFDQNLSAFWANMDPQGWKVLRSPESFEAKVTQYKTKY